jgi:hypothetical protein
MTPDGLAGDGFGVENLAVNRLGAHGFSRRLDVLVGHLGLEVLGRFLKRFNCLANRGAKFRELARTEDDEKNDESQDEPNVAAIDEGHGLDLSLVILGDRPGFDHQPIAVCEVFVPEGACAGDER